MLSQPGLGASASRVPTDIRRFPWVRPLVFDYACRYERLADFYAGNPADPAAWTAAVERARGVERPREAVADMLQAQQAARQAPPAAIAAADRLRRRDTVAVVTGQQVGLFGGPFFTLLKALTALMLAERLRTQFSVPAEAVFWAHGEDHDWEEVRGCTVLDAALEPTSVALGPLPGCGAQPVGRLVLDASVEVALETLAHTLPRTDFTAGLIEDLRAAYRPGTGVADAFARWIERVLGPRGLVVYDGSDPAAKPLARHLFEQELAAGDRTGRLATEAGRALTAQGYHAQVAPQPGGLALFHLNADGRQPIQMEGDDFRIGERVESRAALLELASRAPEEFSPSVLLRSVMQDTIFPTVCYVGGPGELAYFGQLRGVYEAFGVPMPLVVQRISATLLDANAMRFLSRQELPLEALRDQDESALNALLRAQLPAAVDDSLDSAIRAVEERMAEVASAVTTIDSTLEGAARSTLGRMQDDLKKLQAKIIQAAKRKDDTLRRQFHHARAQAFPAGHPQEREVGFVYFLNRYGPGLVDRLADELAPDMGTHWVLTI